MHSRPAHATRGQFARQLCGALIALSLAFMIVHSRNADREPSPPRASDPTSTEFPSGPTSASAGIPHLAPVASAIVGSVPHRSTGPGPAYSGEPAPIGIADYGLQNNQGLTSYSSSSFRGTMEISGLSTYNSSLGVYASAMTFQLNVNLRFQDSGNLYVYWIQDVFSVDTGSNRIEVIDNIWNSSGIGATMHASTVSGNGAIEPPGFYAVVGGLYETLRYPASLSLTVNTSVNSLGKPVVTFMYDVGEGPVTYDTVTFIFAHQLDFSDEFIVDGRAMEPNRLWYDAELILGGPGNLWSTQLQSGSQIALSLDHWNGHNYQTVDDAVNFGSDTGETISNAVSTGEYYTDSGAMFAEVTVGAGGLGWLWSAEWVGTATMTGPNGFSGTMLDGGYSVPYENGVAQVTLYPGTYPFLAAAAGTTESCGTQTIVASGAVAFSCASYYPVDFGESGLPFAVTWGVSMNSETHAGAPLMPTFYLPSGSYPYALSGGAGYMPSPSAGVVSVVTSNVGVSILWAKIAVTSNASSGTVDVGQSVTFSADVAGGSFGDSFAWTGLPAGCPGAASPRLTCSPTSASDDLVGVAVTDLNGFTGVSAPLSFTTFADPSVTPPFGAAPSADVGQEAILSTILSPGSGGDALVWTGLPGGCVSSSVVILSCTVTNAGAYVVTVTVVDSNGFSSSASAAFDVWLAPAVDAPTAVPGGSVLRGQSVTFTATTTQGSGGLSYLWLGLPPGCTSTDASTLRCTPTAEGTWTVTVHVTDSNAGAAESAGLSLTVQASFLGLPAVEGFLLLAVGVAVAALMIALLVIRKGRRSTPTPRSGPTFRPWAPEVEMAAAPAPQYSSPPAGAIGGPYPTDGAPMTAPYWEEGEKDAAFIDPECWNCHNMNPPNSLYCGRCAVPLVPSPGHR